MICSFNFLIFLAVCLNISTVINIKILTNSNQQTQSYKFTSHIAASLSVVLITEMLEICIQTSHDQNVQLILKSYLPVVYGTPSSKAGLWYYIVYGSRKVWRFQRDTQNPSIDKGRRIDNIKPKLILKTNNGLQDNKQKLQMEQHEPHKQKHGVNYM